MARKSRTGRVGAHAREAGFTMIELVVVLFIVALLAALAVPNVSAGLKRAKETALRQNLAVMREAIDDYRADRATWPDSLEVLVADRYIRFIPEDPLAGEQAGWVVIEDPTEGGVVNVRSTAEGIGIDGVPYAEW